jgi:hypothetical protein
MRAWTRSSAARLPCTLPSDPRSPPLITCGQASPSESSRPRSPAQTHTLAQLFKQEVQPSRPKSLPKHALSQIKTAAGTKQTLTLACASGFTTMRTTAAQARFKGGRAMVRTSHLRAYFLTGTGPGVRDLFKSQSGVPPPFALLEGEREMHVRNNARLSLALKNPSTDHRLASEEVKPTPPGVIMRPTKKKSALAPPFFIDGPFPGENSGLMLTVSKQTL